MIKNRNDLQRRVSISLETDENSSIVELGCSRDTAAERDAVGKGAFYAAAAVASEPCRTSRDNSDRPAGRAVRPVPRRCSVFSVELFRSTTRCFSDHFSRLVSIESRRDVCSTLRRWSMVNEHVLSVVESKSVKTRSRSTNDEIELLVNMY